MTKVEPITNESVRSGSEVLREQFLSPTPIDHILQRLSCIELPAKEHFERYMRHKWRINHKPRTLSSSFTSVMFFLDFYGKSGKSDIQKIDRVDLEGFIEQEQDRGLRISTVRTRLACIVAFLHFLMEQDVISGAVLKRSIRLKLADVLPRAMNPTDVRKLLGVIDDIRERALFLLLLGHYSQCSLRPLNKRYTPMIAISMLAYLINALWMLKRLGPNQPIKAITKPM